ncbi:MAG: hypothetical protein DRH24_18965 [Deltaproteobacteria bacterium]|nr:MAG: hypothetical protein DRH24_18965 [Deltaproteobacteria bacterium]
MFSESDEKKGFLPLLHHSNTPQIVKCRQTKPLPGIIKAGSSRRGSDPLGRRLDPDLYINLIRR